MVVIDHSMGGCISRLLITDTGNKVWISIFGKPPEQVPLSPETKKLYTEALIFKHRRDVGRVIFISAPLRGSELGSNWIGRIGSSLVKAPSTLLQAGNEASQFETAQPGELKLKRIPNSVDTSPPTIALCWRSTKSRSRPASRITSSPATVARAATRITPSP
jgi:hypothetical protein